jgi:nicotinamide mononucleotide transporter
MDWTWLITAASIVGVVANIYKRRWCFIVWLFSNGIWCAIDFQAGLYAQSALFAIYFVLAIWGLIKWKKG